MGSTVLVADDNDDCRAMLTLTLKHLGCAVLEARDGLEALGKAVKNRPDLILMDWRMPKLGGLEATKLLKSLRLTKDIPIVICTALGPAAFGYASLLESIEVLQKPLRLDRIKELIQNLPQKNHEKLVPLIMQDQIVDVQRAYRVLRKLQHISEQYEDFPADLHFLLENNVAA